MELYKEKKLVEQAKTDPLAFGKLYDIYYPRIFNYIFHRTGNFADATDITSNVFFKVMRYIINFKWKDIPFSSWIYKIASNEINSHFRKKRFWFLSLGMLYNNFGFEVADETNIEEDYEEAQTLLERYEDFRHAQKILKTLPNKYQDVIALRFFENKKIREISEITGKNSNTIKSLLSRGIEKLRYQLIQEKEDENCFLEMQPKSTISVLKVEDKKL